MIAVYASMKLQYTAATRHLMKIVDVLGYHCFELPCLFQFCKFEMCRIRLRSITEHLVTVKLVKFLRMTHKERMAQNGFRRIIIFLVI